ncbi:30S ribosomal protein S8 [Candidatus Vidania fulgoroideorum]
MYNFHLSDFVTRFNNCASSLKKIVYFRYSGFILNIIKVFKCKCYISRFTYSNRNIAVIIRYVNGLPIVRRIVLVSKPSKRVYKKVKHLVPCSFLNEFYSTSSGIIDTNYAISLNTCGEFLFKVYTNV